MHFRAFCFLSRGIGNFVFISHMPLLQASVRAKKLRWHDIDFCSWISDVDRLLRISSKQTAVKTFVFTAVVIDSLDYVFLARSFWFCWQRMLFSRFISEIIREIRIIRSHFVWLSVDALDASGAILEQKLHSFSRTHYDALGKHDKSVWQSGNAAAVPRYKYYGILYRAW